MKLATLRFADGHTCAARIDDRAHLFADIKDIQQLLRQPEWKRRAPTDSISLDEVTFAPLILEPRKIVCVGMNYVKHIEEMGRDQPAYPTLFVKFADALCGAYDEVTVPRRHANALDFEGELAIIIGAKARNVAQADAEDYIAGYTVANDVSARDLQFRTMQFHQGKSLEKSSALGPWLVTDRPTGKLSTRVNGELMQHSPISDLLFDAPALIEYISHLYPLYPGDVILTGTPSGVGHAREPKRYIRDGDEVSVAIDGIGEIKNRFRIASR